MSNKYIIVKSGGLETPILFPDTLSHRSIAQAVSGEVISAGFWTVESDCNHDLVYYAYGESYTLNLKSREEDSDILNRFFEGN